MQESNEDDSGPDTGLFIMEPPPGLRHGPLVSPVRDSGRLGSGGQSWTSSAGAGAGAASAGTNPRLQHLSATRGRFARFQGEFLDAPQPGFCGQLRELNPPVLSHESNLNTYVHFVKISFFLL